LAGIASVYLLALWYLDRDKHVLSRLGDLAGPLAVCALLVLCSYLLRYQRWHVLLRVQGHPVASWRAGLVAYLAGLPSPPRRARPVSCCVSAISRGWVFHRALRWLRSCMSAGWTWP